MKPFAQPYRKSGSPEDSFQRSYELSLGQKTERSCSRDLKHEYFEIDIFLLDRWWITVNIWGHILPILAEQFVPGLLQISIEESFGILAHIVF